MWSSIETTSSQSPSNRRFAQLQDVFRSGRRGIDAHTHRLVASLRNVRGHLLSQPGPGHLLRNGSRCAPAKMTAPLNTSGPRATCNANRGRRAPDPPTVTPMFSEWALRPPRNNRLTDSVLPGWLSELLGRIMALAIKVCLLMLSAKVDTCRFGDAMPRGRG